MAKMTDRINIWDNITGASFIAASMYNWRIWMGQDFNFENFLDTYLTPLDEYASTIICPRQCGYCELGNRRIVEMNDGSFEAICDEMCGKEFVIDRQETLYYTIKESTLVLAIAKVMGITPYAAKLEKPDSSWKVGSINVKGENVQVFLTLKWQDRYLLELIFNLNRIMHDQYILLGTKQSIMSHGLTDLLHDGGGTFVPLNETIDFNQDAELELMKPFNWEKLLLSQDALTEEPDNIFRKCGDAWEIRFDGGEKFLLTGADTGSKYLHFMLGKPGVSTPITEIMREVFGESESVMSVDILDDGILTEGYTIGDPNTNTESLADNQALKQYKDELKKIRHDIEAAKASGDNATAEQLENDLDDLMKNIQAIVSPAGQRKSFANSQKNIANACRGAVNFAIDKIGIYDTAFSKYLQATIKGGRNPGYFPVDALHWFL
jgi:hypothetical protein